MQPTLLRILEESRQRQLPFLLIGGNAVILMGFARNTIDIDLLVPESARSPWLDALVALGFRPLQVTSVFAQFHGGQQWVPVDLMFVSDSTWQKLNADPFQTEVLGHCVRLPRPEHLIALKLHATASPYRSKPESDWEDIRQIILRQKLDTQDPSFRELVIRYGGENALRRIDSL